jgi:hypothetical protein
METPGELRVAYSDGRWRMAERQAAVDNSAPFQSARCLVTSWGKTVQANGATSRKLSRLDCRRTQIQWTFFSALVLQGISPWTEQKLYSLRKRLGTPP